eukprot:COSAG02_NODE_43829_length_371_cov_0.937500_1_plen_29_part_10
MVVNEVRGLNTSGNKGFANRAYMQLLDAI